MTRPLTIIFSAVVLIGGFFYIGYVGMQEDLPPSTQAQ